MVGVQGLSDLTQYVEALSKVVERPYLRSSQYTHLYLEEGQFRGLPGINNNLDNNVWLKLERLPPTPPPNPPPGVKPWVTLSADAAKNPKVKEHIVLTLTEEMAAKLVAARRVGREDGSKKSNAPEDFGKADVFLRLSAFPEYQAKISDYVGGPWAEWSTKEKGVRATKAIYEKLFALQKSIEAGTVVKPVEIIWGLGLLHWKHPQLALLHHHLIEVPVELVLDPDTAAVSVRPVGRRPRLAENFVSAIAPESSAILFNNASNHLQQAEGITPYAADTFIPLLRFITTHLDPEGEFWNASEGENTPQRNGREHSNDHLVVTTDWAIYARPRTENFIIEDLRTQREKLEVHYSSGENPPGFRITCRTYPYQP